MNSLYMHGILNLKDIEISHFKESRFGKSIGYLGSIDFNRPAILNDFPYLKEVEDENDFGSANFIKAIFISNKSISDDIKNYLEELSDSFIGNKEDCFWNIDFLQVSLSVEELTPIDILDLYLKTLENEYNHLHCKLSRKIQVLMDLSYYILC